MVEIEKKDLCIVHIGMPKTGSSTLQNVLFSSIVDHNVSYANLPVPNHSAIIYSMFSSRPQDHHLHSSVNNSLEVIEQFNKKNRDSLIEGFTTKKTNIEIISGEDIFHLDEDSLIRMKEFLENYFKKIIIVGYIRKPYSFMNSAFQQLVKNHHLSTFDFEIIYPHYQFKLEKFDNVFGKENVDFIKFDLNAFPDNDVVLDFIQRYNIEINYNKRISDNETLSKEIISLLFLDNREGKTVETTNPLVLQNELVKILSPIGNEKLKFKHDLLKQVFLEYEKDLQWIEKRLDDKLIDLPEKNQANSVALENELFDFALTVFNELQKILKNRKIDFTINEKNHINLLEMLYLLKVDIAKNLKIYTYPKVKLILNASLDFNAYSELSQINSNDKIKVFNRLSDFPSRKAFPWQKEENEQILYSKNDNEAQQEIEATLTEAIKHFQENNIFNVLWNNNSLFNHDKKILPVLKNLLDKNLIELDIIIYLNEYSDWSKRSYLQWGIKHKTYPGFIKRYQEWNGHKTPRYYQMIKKVIDIFPDNTHIRNTQDIINLTLDFQQNFSLPISVEYNNTKDSIEEIFLRTIFNNSFFEPVAPNRFNDLIKRNISTSNNIDSYINYLMPTEEDISILNKNIREDRFQLNQLLKNRGEKPLLEQQECEEEKVDLNKLIRGVAELAISQSIKIEKLEKELEALKMENNVNR